MIIQDNIMGVKIIVGEQKNHISIQDAVATDAPKITFHVNGWNEMKTTIDKMVKIHCENWKS